jgi:transcriptional regulator with XRE-family HTH domain
MNTLNILLDKAVAACSPSNGEELGRRIGVSRSAVSKWRTGGVITEKHLTALISIAHADPRLAITVLQEQATTAPERSVWGSLARQLGAAAAVAVAALMPLGNAQAGTLTRLNESHFYALCEMAKRRLLRLLPASVGPSRLAHAA